jgi:uncharacterized membrane protein YeaQ/YmgE (transglycosylase-associated protein family)
MTSLARHETLGPTGGQVREPSEDVGRREDLPTVSTTNSEGSTKLGIVTWIVLGIVAGYLASKFMSSSDGGLLQLLMLIGIGGAIVGGFGASYFGMGDLRTFTLFASLFVACGAIGVLFGSGMLLLAFGSHRR